MADFSSSGLWSASKEYIAGGGMIETESLELPESLVKELEDWVFAFEDLWYNHYSDIVTERVPKFNAWGKVLATKIHQFLGPKGYEVWYCYQDEDYGREAPVDKDAPAKYCIITRKSDDVTLGYSLISKVEAIGVEQNHYYPVVRKIPVVGTVFIPRDSVEFPGCLEWKE